MIGVVVLNYNSISDTLKCMDFLSRQEDVILDIIIIDNHSASSEEVTALQKICAKRGARFKCAASNNGYNAGNNIGIRMALESGCDAVLIANPDMEFPDSQYVATLYHELMLRPDCAAISGAIIGPDGRHQTPMTRDGAWTQSFSWLKMVLTRSRKDAGSDGNADFIDNPYEPHNCAKLSGCCLMLSSAYLKKHGLMDENVFLYCEESILSRQVESVGYKMYYTPAVSAVHRHVSVKKGDPRPRFRHWRDSRLYFIKKYSSWPWYGRVLASLSFRMYAGVMIMLKSIRN